MKIARRGFLKTSFAAAPLLAGGMPFGMPRSALFDVINGGATDRVLVLINLVGGNDGLNSLVPLDQYDNLAAVRGNVLLPQNKLVGLTSTLGLHPSLTPFDKLWKEGSLGIIQGVGYPDQNGSHFRSADIWATASAADEVITTGWLGRQLDRDYPGFPENYPNADATDPVAISMGSAASETCQGSVSNFSLAVRDPRYTISVFETPDAQVPDSGYGRELDFLRTAASQTNAYGEVVRTKVTKGFNLATYPSDNYLADQLRWIARMISGGLKTRVYVATLGGFDTHASQVVDGKPLEGEHARLLDKLAKAIGAFQADLNALGIAERVIGMTFSEFGRRIRSNAAFGTDHGAAAPQFLFGACVNAKVLGANPTIDRAVDEQESLPMQYDFRDVYGSVLEEWFAVAPADVRRVLYAEYTRLPIISPCGTVDVRDAAPIAPLAMAVSPSVFSASTTVTFTTVADARVELEAYDMTGRRLETLFSRKLPAGEHTVTVLTGAYPAGVVVFRLREGAQVRVVRGVRG